MSQIGFTHKTEEIYSRFQAMRREYESQHGRTYAPDFLAVLMDAWENRQRKGFVLCSNKNPKLMVLDRKFACDPKAIFTELPEEALVFETIPDAEGFRWIGGDVLQNWLIIPLNALPFEKPVSLRSYIADIEANDPQLKTGWAGTEPDEFLREHGYRTELEKPDANRVVIRSTVASGMYLEKAYSFDNLFDLTNHKECAMVFDNEEQAKAFLRKCGRVVEEWILESENEQ